jgi:hypothetical protein
MFPAVVAKPAWLLAVKQQVGVSRRQPVVLRPDLYDCLPSRHCHSLVPG